MFFQWQWQVKVYRRSPLIYKWKPGGHQYTWGSRAEITKILKNSQGEILSYKESSPAWYGTVHQNELPNPGTSLWWSTKNTAVLLEKIEC